MTTLTTHQAMELLKVSRPQFARMVHKFGFVKVTEQTGRGKQTEWDAERIQQIAEARQMFKPQVTPAIDK